MVIGLNVAIPEGLFRNVIVGVVHRHLYIEPVRDLCDDRPILRTVAISTVIVSVDEEEVGYRLIPPLKTRINIHVIDLVVILHNSAEKDVARESEIQAWTEQHQSFGWMGIFQRDIVYIVIHAY